MANRRTYFVNTRGGRYLALRGSDLAPGETALGPSAAWKVLERVLLHPSELAQLYSLGKAIAQGGSLPSGSLNARALQRAFESGEWVLVPSASRTPDSEKAVVESVVEQIKVARTLKTWIEFEVVDDRDRPMAGQEFTCMLPDGTIHVGTLDKNGRARFDGIDPGNCSFSLSAIHASDWNRP